MFFVVLFVAMFQTTVGFQLLRLSGLQASINQNSVPLLHETQKFARLTTQVLSQTVLLENDLTREELTELRQAYEDNRQRVDRVFRNLLSIGLAEDVASEFQISRRTFSRINEELFSNQFFQRSQEDAISQARAELLKVTLDMKDELDRLLVRWTTRMMAPAGPYIFDTDNESDRVRSDLSRYLIFAGEIEVLNTLRSNVLDISSMLEHSSIGQDFDVLEANLHYRLRSIGQSLILLDNNDERARLAKFAAKIRDLLAKDDGFVVLLRKNDATRTRFNQVKRSQAAAVGEIDKQTEQVVAEANERFEHQVLSAATITRTIMWIGFATTAFVLIGIYFVNGTVIRKQIGERFTKLTEDVVAISAGDYSRKIRVRGHDEIGAIANALDVFKGQAGELQRSNAELEKFAYVAAHDLRSPLDAIRDLARWTLEDERAQLSDTCIQNLELIVKRSLRLSALQSDLLTYAKVSEIDATVETFELADTVEKLADLLDPNSNFNIQLIGDPGVITTFGLPTRQILLNLVTNAIKHHDKESGNISIYYEKSETCHKFTVEDDGPGIEPRYQAKIFELFKTLQSRDKVEGSGLGLALVSKLIERLDGRLLVYSDAPDKRGAKFIFEVADMADAGGMPAVAA